MQTRALKPFHNHITSTVNLVLVMCLGGSADCLPQSQPVLYFDAWGRMTQNSHKSFLVGGINNPEICPVNSRVFLRQRWSHRAVARRQARACAWATTASLCHRSSCPLSPIPLPSTGRRPAHQQYLQTQAPRGLHSLRKGKRRGMQGMCRTPHTTYER